MATNAQSIIATIAQSASQTFELEIAVGTAALRALTELPVTLMSVGSGDLEVSLNWGVELHVLEPSGEEIHQDKASATAGMLDLNSNAAVSVSSEPGLSPGRLKRRHPTAPPR